MIWCFCVHDALFEGYACSIQSKQREKFHIDFRLIFPTLFIFSSIFIFCLFFVPFFNQEKMMMMMIFSKSRSIGKLTTQ